MKGVFTSYNLNGTVYGSYIAGGHLDQINERRQYRGLNETIESQICDIKPIENFSLLSDEEFERRIPEILHSSCFLAFIALKAGAMSIESMLGDEGIIHELSHYISKVDGCHKKSIRCLKEMLHLLMQKATGAYEPM